MTSTSKAFKAYLVSDIHLRDENERNSQTLLRFFAFIENENPRATHLVLLGDIFDLWISDHVYFREKFAKIVEAIGRLKRLGIEVFYFEGNHDLYLKDFWEDEVGVQVFSEPYLWRESGFQIRLEHGDYINPDDKGYLFLRAVLRLSMVRLLGQNLPDKWIKFIGERASRASREYTSTKKSMSEPSVRQMIHDYAQAKFVEQPFDILVTGHVHLQDEFAWVQDGKKIRSINLGSWYAPAQALLLEVQDDNLLHRFVSL